MHIAIIDADLIGRKKHRFPNLVCLKLSAWHKSQCDQITLKTDYDGLNKYDHVYIVKVFTDTPVDEAILKLPNVEYGGTGFFYDRAVPLPDYIEHIMPDYTFYDTWVQERLNEGGKRNDYKYYLDYSIGFLTRGCFRRCPFCVNRNSTGTVLQAHLDEFYVPDRKKICLLDDNFLACSEWRELLQELKDTGRPFVFRQGLDERLLTREKVEALFSAKYDGDYIFAFDNIADADLIESKLKMLRQCTPDNRKNVKFYCFTGYDRNGIYDADFYRQDIADLFRRIEILMQYNCLPYVMRHIDYQTSPWRGMYITMARWINQPSFYRKQSLYEYVYNTDRSKSADKYLTEFATAYPDIAEKYYNMKLSNIRRYVINGSKKESKFRGRSKGDEGRP